MKKQISISNNEENTSPGFPRRGLIKGVSAGFAALGAGAQTAAQTAAADSGSTDGSRDLIRRENEPPGTRDWMLTKTKIDPPKDRRSPSIEGYCSATSVAAGDFLQIMVSTNPESKFTWEIFRTGYYGGTGGR